MLNGAERGKYKNIKHMHINKTLKTAGVQTIMLKHPTKQFTKKENDLGSLLTLPGLVQSVTSNRYSSGDPA